MHSQFPFRLSDGQDRPGSQSKLRRSSRLRYPSSHPLFRFFRKELALLSLFTFVMVALQLRSRVSIFEAYTSAYFETHDIRKSLVTPSLEHRKLAAASYPSYLPISQHLKTLNLTKKKPSLEDMVYGSQRRSLPDLGSTDNRDLKDCLQCTEHAQEVREADIPVKAKFHLAKILIRLFAYYDIASLMTFPCADEIQWLFPVVKIMKRLNPLFVHYCALPNDYMVVDMIKSYGRPGITGTQFMVYSPSTRGIIPTPDLVFTWKGIEQYNLDDIHTFFRDIATNGVTYALIGNSPGVPNAEMAEKGSNTFSIVRPQSPSLNVRAFPFGFNKATRVFHMPEKQLLFYNASEMRDSW